MKKILLSIFVAASCFAFDMSSFAGGAAVPSVAKEVKESKKSYEELISSIKNSGNGEFYLYLAIIYANGMPEPDDFGKTVPKDIDQAVLYFNKSVEAGYLKAAPIAGSLFLYNEDFMTRKDNVKTAKQFLEHALKSGEKDIENEASPALADIYANYEKDIEKSINLLNQCAKNGSSTCQLMMGLTYFHGINEGSFLVKKNEEIASKYLTEACTNKEKKIDRVEDFCKSAYVEKVEIK